MNMEKEVKNMDLVRRETAFDNARCDWIKVAREQMVFFADIKQYMINLELVKKNLDAEIEDILDYIETTNYNVAQGYRIYRMLRERRVQRKNAVTEIRQLQALTELLDCEQMKSVYQKSIAKMEQDESEEWRSYVIQQLLEQDVS